MAIISNGKNIVERHPQIGNLCSFNDMNRNTWNKIDEISEYSSTAALHCDALDNRTRYEHHVKPDCVDFHPFRIIVTLRV